MTVNIRAYFHTLYSVPFIYLCVFMPNTTVIWLLWIYSVSWNQVVSALFYHMFWTSQYIVIFPLNCRLYFKRDLNNKKKVFLLTLLPLHVLCISFCRPIFLCSTIFFLPQGLPLTLFIVQVCWWLILSTFACLKKSLFHLCFWMISCCV